MNRQLKRYIEEIRQIPIDGRLSDDAVIALMDIHLSLTGMIVANMLEDEFGDPEFHREAMDRLFAICGRRSRGGQSLARSSRMTPAMYDIFRMPDTVFDIRRHASCLRRSFRMADEWYERTGHARTPDDKTRMTGYGVLQSISDAFAYASDEDRETSGDFLYLKRRIGDWASELDGGCCWSGLSDYEAVRRIGIMLGHADAYGDNGPGMKAENALRFYSDRITGGGHADGRTLFHLCRALLWETGCQDGRRIDAAAGCAVRMLKSPAAADRDERLWYMAVLIGRECCRISYETKRKVLAYSA